MAGVSSRNPFPPPPVEGVRLGAQVGHEEVEVGVPVHIPEQHPHAGLGAPLRVQRGAEEQRGVGEAAVRLLFPEQVRLAVVRHIEVEPAVAGEVVAEDAECGKAGFEDSGIPGDILERAAAMVPEERVPLVGEALGRAEIRLAGGGDALPARTAHQVAAHIEVEVGIAVVVAKRRRAGPAVPEDPRGRRLEPAAFATVEGVPAVVRDEHIGVAVAVHIPDCDSRAVARVAQPAPGGGVAEGAIGLLQEEAVPRQLRRGDPAAVLGKRAGLDQVEIEIAVAVGVEERGARPHDRREREAREVAGVVDERDSQPLGDLGERRFGLAGPNGGRRKPRPEQRQPEQGNRKTRRREVHDRGNPVSGPVPGASRGGRRGILRALPPRAGALRGPPPTPPRSVRVRRARRR